MAALPDPCPLPGKQRNKGLNDKERLVYAPMADVGGLLFDKDAVYIDLPDWKVTLAMHTQHLPRHWACSHLQLACAVSTAVGPTQLGTGADGCGQCANICRQSALCPGSSV